MKKTGWIVLAVVGVILAALLFFYFKDSLFPGAQTTAGKKQTEIVSEQPEGPREKIVRKMMPVSPPEEQISGPPAVKEITRDILQERVEGFFSYLDQQEYIQAYNLPEGTYQHFLGITSELSSHLPVVSGEMSDLSLLRSNIAHFFRVIGRENIRLALDILSHERGGLEDDMAILFEWGMREARKEEGAIAADINTLYEYSVFFLNTVGGKAYLLRRESRVRILLTYYAILILDRANEQHLNRHGVDISPHLTLLVNDIKRYKGLDHKERYLAQLGELEKRNRR